MRMDSSKALWSISSSHISRQGLLLHQLLPAWDPFSRTPRGYHHNAPHIRPQWSCQPWTLRTRSPPEFRPYQSKVLSSYQKVTKNNTYGPASAASVHKKPIFVQETSLGCQSVHKFIVFVQQSAAEDSAVHKKPIFVQETSLGYQSVHKFIVFVQQSAAEDSAVHIFIVFVQQSAAGGSAVHKFIVFVQQNAAEDSAVHKKPIFVQETNSGYQSVHIFVVFVQQSAAEDSARKTLARIRGKAAQKHQKKQQNRQGNRREAAEQHAFAGMNTISESMHLPGCIPVPAAHQFRRPALSGQHTFPGCAHYFRAAHHFRAEPRK